MMAFRKFNKVESTEVLSKTDHDTISEELHRVGKTTVGTLSQKEKEALAAKIAQE